MLQVQDKVKGLSVPWRCRLCRHLNPYARVDGCMKRVGDAVGSKAAGLATLSCRCYVTSPRCFACGIIIRPHGSSPVAVPLEGTKGVTCEDCAETLKVRGYFRFGLGHDGREHRWRLGDGIFEAEEEEITDSTHED